MAAATAARTPTARRACLHGNVRVEGGTEQFRGRLSADASDNKRLRGGPDGWTRHGDAVRRQQYAGRLEWPPTQAGSFWFDASAYRETDEQRYQYYARPTAVPQRKTEDIDRNRYTYGGQWRFGNGVRARLAGVAETYDTTTREYSNSFQTATRNSSQRTDHVSTQFDLPAWYPQLWQFGADFHREQLDQTVNGASELAGNAERRTGELYFQNDILFSETWEMVVLACAASRTRTSAAIRAEDGGAWQPAHNRGLEGRGARQLRPGLSRAEPQGAALSVRPQLARLHGHGQLQPQAGIVQQLPARRQAELAR